MRQLPPSMTKDVFLESVSPLPPYNEFYYVDGDLILGEFAFSRAYIKFTNFDDLCIFKDKFDGYVFIDNSGNEYTAIVEFAPLQKMPRRFGNTEMKVDTKANTIDEDTDFVAFQEDLKNCVSVSPTFCSSTTDAALEEIENRDLKDSDAQITPLVEFLNKKHEERKRMREERKRKKDEAKKKKEDDMKVNKEKKIKERKAKDKEHKKKNSPEKTVDKGGKPEKPYVIKVKAKEPKAEGASSSKDGEPPKKDEQKTVKPKSEDKANVNDNVRVKNKDRPAREIYRPGAARQKKQSEPKGNQPQQQSSQSDSKEGAQPDESRPSQSKPSQSQAPPHKFKNRVFTRTRN